MFIDLTEKEIERRVRFPNTIGVECFYDFSNDIYVRVQSYAADLEYGDDVIGRIKFKVGSWEGNGYNTIFTNELIKENLIERRMNVEKKIREYADIFSLAYNRKYRGMSSEDAIALPNGAFREPIKDLYTNLVKYSQRKL